METIRNEFEQKNMILFVGSQYANIMDDRFIELPWKCIITTNSMPELAKRCNVKRMYNAYDEIQFNSILCSDSCDLIQIYGNGFIPDDLLDEDDKDLSLALEKEQGNEIFKRIMKKLDGRCHLVVVGFDERVENEMSCIKLLDSLRSICGGTVSFYECYSDKLAKFAEKNGYKWYEESVLSFFDREELEEGKEYVNINPDSYTTYKDGKPIFISKDVIIRNEPIAQLLTMERVNEIQPKGKIEKAKWFYNFLNDSADAPQWYGYSENSLYYLERNYESELLDFVEKRLEGKEYSKKVVPNAPIILEGGTCSSKSIELGAVAYKIFTKKKNPVVFMHSGYASFYHDCPEIIALEELMREIDDSDSRVLIVWDSSSRKDVGNEAKNLVRLLGNMGRRFVLLCSAYRFYAVDEKRIKLEKWKNVEVGNECYFIETERNLNIQEKNGLFNEVALFKRKVNDYLYNVDDEKVEEAYQKIDNSLDIFDYYYRLIELIRPQLEAGALREQRIVSKYVKSQLENGKNSEDEKAINTMSLWLKNANITMEELGLDDNDLEKIDETEDSMYDLDAFNNCVAMFGQFKLEMPYTLAMMVICKGHMKYNTYALFDSITKYIDYIHYIEDADGNATFRSRNPLEAIKNLEHNNVTSEKQMQLLLLMIDYYVQDAKENGVPDPEIKSALSNIIKMYGPNSNDKEWMSNDRGGEQDVRSYFLKHQDTIIDKLEEVRKSIGDEEAILTSQEITLVREFYGGQWKTIHGGVSNNNTCPWKSCYQYFNGEAYKKRLKKLSDNSRLAQETLNMLQTKGERAKDRDMHTYVTIQNTMNNVTVELCLTNLYFSKTKDEYLQYCHEMKIEDRDIDQIKTLPYKVLYKALYKTILKNPNNGYFYNTIFQLFEMEYQKPQNGAESKLELLSEILLIVDDASTLTIDNRGSRGRDELSQHIAEVSNYAAEHSVSIDMIKDKNCVDVFKEMFQRLLNQNSAAAICFVCQQELEKAGLSGRMMKKWREENEGKTFILDEVQLEICKKIWMFMNDSEYHDAIENSPQAIYLMLNVFWMLHNKRPIDTGKEWQRTYLNTAQWEKVGELCGKYEGCNKDSVRPIVALLHALSMVQLNNRYADAANDVRRKAQNIASRRPFVTYLICDENGVPKVYAGEVQPDMTKAGTGWIRIDRTSEIGNCDIKVRCYIHNMGWRHIPIKKERVNKFAMGLSYTGTYSAHAYEEEDDNE